MKTEKWMTIAGVAACLGLALSLTTRADESSTNAPAKPTAGHHRGPGVGHGPGGGAGGAFLGENREEMQKFRESLKDLPEDQRQAALQKHRQEMAEKMKAAMKEHAQQFKERIEQSTRLTAEQKQHILGVMEKQMQATKEFMENLHKTTQAEREKIMQDSTLNEEQKRAAMLKVMEKAREELKAHREQMEAKRKEIMEKFREQLGPEHKPATDTKSGV